MPKILITEDDPGILKLYNEALLSEGFEVETSLNGQEALEKLNVFKPNIILLDLEMPILDGETFLIELNKLMPDESIRPQIVIFTNWQTRKPAELVEKYHLSGYFVKLKANIVDVIENLKKVSKNEEVDWLDVM